MPQTKQQRTNEKTFGHSSTASRWNPATLVSNLWANISGNSAAMTTLIIFSKFLLIVMAGHAALIVSHMADPWSAPTSHYVIMGVGVAEILLLGYYAWKKPQGN